ncbi:unnamed protein product [Bemisia tabaci]|uniref:HECT-type E3 ubiquitin transferase n=2 Tax=Bemisia tabaci TaxID=7038 RepID=A0A9P0ALX1_BEMTA|nr:unnamed protein product [Bemisia tabaci]
MHSTRRAQLAIDGLLTWLRLYNPSVVQLKVFIAEPVVSEFRGVDENQHSPSMVKCNATASQSTDALPLEEPNGTDLDRIHQQTADDNLNLFFRRDIVFLDKSSSNEISDIEPWVADNIKLNFLICSSWSKEELQAKFQAIFPDRLTDKFQILRCNKGILFPASFCYPNYKPNAVDLYFHFYDDKQIYLRNYTDELLCRLSKCRRRLNFDCEQEINVAPSSSINSANYEFIVDETHSTHSSAQKQIKEDDFTALNLFGNDQSLDPFEEEEPVVSEFRGVYENQHSPSMVKCNATASQSIDALPLEEPNGTDLDRIHQQTADDNLKLFFRRDIVFLDNSSSNVISDIEPWVADNVKINFLINSSWSKEELQAKFQAIFPDRLTDKFQILRCDNGILVPAVCRYRNYEPNGVDLYLYFSDEKKIYLRNYTDELLCRLSKCRRRLNFDCEQEINVAPSSSINSANDEFIVDETHSTHSSAQNQIKEDDLTALNPSGDDQSLDPFEVIQTHKNTDNFFDELGPEIVGPQVLVSRNSPYEGLRSYVESDHFNVWRNFQVEFRDEFASDVGGLSREFLDLLVTHTFNSSMFHGDGKAKRLRLSLSHLQNDHYYLAGITIALNIIHRGPSCSFMSDDLYDSLLGKRVSTWSASDIDDDSWRYALTQLEACKDIETAQQVLKGALFQGLGIDPFVTIMAEVTKVIRDCLEYYFVHRVAAPMKQLRKGLKVGGFFRIIKSNSSFFRGLFVAQNKPLTVETMETLCTVKRHINPEGVEYALETKVLVHWSWFLEDLKVGRETDGQTLELLLGWITGCTTIPFGGFNRRIQIMFLHGESNPLPTANTCALQIHLPVVNVNYRDFKQFMLKAMTMGKVFGIG